MPLLNATKNIESLSLSLTVRAIGLIEEKCFGDFHGPLDVHVGGPENPEQLWVVPGTEEDLSLGQLGFEVGDPRHTETGEQKQSFGIQCVVANWYLYKSDLQ